MSRELHPSFVRSVMRSNLLGNILFWLLFGLTLTTWSWGAFKLKNNENKIVVFGIALGLTIATTVADRLVDGFDEVSSDIALISRESRIKHLQDAMSITSASVPLLEGDVMDAEYEEPEAAIGNEEVCQVLADYQIYTDCIGTVEGYSFIRHKLIPVQDVNGKLVKINAIAKMAEDIQVAMALDAPPFIESGKGFVSVDLPKSESDREFFDLEESLQDVAGKTKSFSAIIGRDLERKTIAIDLSDPNSCHLLVGGTTGSGKSEFLRAFVCSLMSQFPPSSMRLVMVDPKRVTFPEFGQCPWLHTPIVKDEEAAIEVMQSLVEEMQSRYQSFESIGVQNIDEYNARKDNPMPRIVCIFDEYADFMVEKETKTELEKSIKRLGAMARAAGIHLVLATQRPDANVVTPLIRSNLPGRIALKTASDADSKIILGGTQTEASYLLGKGDLLLNRSGKSIRLQSPYASSEFIRSVIGSGSSPQSTQSLPQSQPQSTQTQSKTSPPKHTIVEFDRDELARVLAEFQELRSSALEDDVVDSATPKATVFSETRERITSASQKNELSRPAQAILGKYIQKEMNGTMVDARWVQRFAFYTKDLKAFSPTEIRSFFQELSKFDNGYTEGSEDSLKWGIPLDEDAL